MPGGGAQIAAAVAPQVFASAFGKSDPGTPGSGDFYKIMQAELGSILAEMFGGFRLNPFGPARNKEGTRGDIISPEGAAFPTFMRQLLPFFSANVGNLQRAGAAAQQQTAGSLANRGLGGTGIGEGLRGLTATAPGISIFNARNAFNQDVFNKALSTVLTGVGTRAGIPFQGAGAFQPSLLGTGLDAAANFLIPYFQQKLSRTPSGHNPKLESGPFTDTSF